MKKIVRREFIKQSINSAGSVIAAPAFIKQLITNSPNDRVTVAVIGISGERPRVRGMIRGRGIVHVRNYVQVPNVMVTTLCDVDEKLFPSVVAEVEELYGSKPKTEYDYREVLDNKDIESITVL